mmetsp:Transcript_16595/g.15879  ORF Transcript_16595/g.15879 Transcript_16595/m.15879 type:complete len:429 (-) Transcript_16595:282-1568(-)
MVTFISNGDFRKKEDLTPIEHRYQTFREIPSQIDPEKGQTMETAAVIMEGTIIAAGPSSLVLSFILSFSLSQLWGLINALQVITLLPAMSVAFPANAEYFISLLATIANFDLVDVSPLVYKIVPMDPKYSENAQAKFQAMGITSTNLIDNLSNLLLMVLTMVAALLLFLFLKLLKRLENRIVTFVSNFLGAILFYSWLIRTFIESYLNFAISGFMALDQLSFTHRADSAQSIITLLFVGFCLAFPLFTLIFLFIQKVRLDEQVFVQKYESLYESILTLRWNYLYTPIFLFRRLFIVLVIMYLDFSLELQLAFLLNSSVGYLAYIVHTKPFHSKFLNAMELFNEAAILIGLYHCFCFTDAMPSYSARYNLGTGLIAFFCFAIIVNLFFMVKATALAIKELLVREYRKCKKKKNQVASENAQAEAIAKRA